MGDTMRAFVQAEIGGTPELTEFPRPQCGDCERIAVTSAGLNPFDAVYAAGRHAIGPPATPYVVGHEGIGTTGDGRRVYFEGAVSPFGALGPEAQVCAENQYEVRPDVDDATALALGVVGIAAWLPLVERAGVNGDDTVVVLGSTGAVGTLAIQIAKILGAARVVAVGRRVEALERNVLDGADAAVRIEPGADLAAAIGDATAGRVDVVIDLLWGEPARAALQVCSPRARFVQVGSSAATDTPLPANPWRTRWVTILGYSSFLATSEQKHEAYAALLDHAAAGRLTVETQEWAFEETPAAWRQLAEGSWVKLVVRL